MVMPRVFFVPKSDTMTGKIRIPRAEKCDLATDWSHGMMSWGCNDRRGAKAQGFAGNTLDIRSSIPIIIGRHSAFSPNPLSHTNSTHNS